MNIELNRKSVLLLSLPLLITLVFGIYFRFIHITVLGIYGSDVFFYWQMAHDWMNGHEHLSQHFRPFIYWLDSLAMSLTGPNDWILKTFNALLDSLTAIILVYLGFILRRSLILGLCFACAYLWLPMPLEMARTELVHTPSTFFLLVSFLFMFRWFQSLKSWQLFLSGLFLGASWNIHPDLAVLGASFALVIFYKGLNSYRGSWLSQSLSNLKNFLVFLGGYFFIFAIFSLKFGLIELITNLLENQKAQSSGLRGSLLWRVYHFSHLYLSENLGPLLYVLFFLSIFYVFYKMKKKFFTSFDLVFLSFPACYLFFCALLFSRFELPRLLLPFVPLLLIFIFTSLYDFANKYSKEAVLVLALLTVGLNWNSYLMVKNQMPSPYKMIHETFSPLLQNDEKLLIGPISVDHIHTPLSHGVYLKGRGVYLASTTSGSLAEVLHDENIGYVWIADVLYEPRTFGEFLKFTYEERLLTLFNMKPEGYDPTIEKELLRSFVKEKGAQLIHQSNLGELYELK